MQALAVAAGFILWKRAKGHERIKRSRESGGGGKPRKASESGKRFQMAKRRVRTNNWPTRFPDNTLKV
jgi:hypothetical protein